LCLGQMALLAIMPDLLPDAHKALPVALA
jgi:hypothetical protein